MRPLCLLVLASFALSSTAWGQSAEHARYCYEQVKKMGFSSRETEDRSWEDCMTQFHRPTHAPPPNLTPEQRALLLQQMQQPAANPGLEAGRGMLRSLCNSEGGYYTPDGQCLRLMSPQPQPPARLPSWRCQQTGNTTNCTSY